MGSCTSTDKNGDMQQCVVSYKHTNKVLWIPAATPTTAALRAIGAYMGVPLPFYLLYKHPSYKPDPDVEEDRFTIDHNLEEDWPNVTRAFAQSKELPTFELVRSQPNALTMAQRLEMRKQEEAKAATTPPSNSSQVHPASSPEHKSVTATPSGVSRKLMGTNHTISHDVMISYETGDADFAMWLKDFLTKQGMAVFMVKPGANVKDIGSHVVGSRKFLLVLTARWAKSPSCRDELSLAHLSDKPVSTVVLGDYKEFEHQLDFSTKLTLSSSKWFKFPLDNSKWIGNDDAMGLVAHLKQAAIAGDFDDFWKTHFGDESSVDWEAFQETVQNEYKEEIGELFSGREQWLMDMIRKDVFKGATPTYENFVAFVSDDSKAADSPSSISAGFWEQVKGVAVNKVAITEIFDARTEPSVRLAAIERLGKSPNRDVLLGILIQLMRTGSPNVRAVVAVGLGRVGGGSADVTRALISATSDSDRLVREAACLVLSVLKVREAVPSIVHLWRNDAISTVRAAAGLALEAIGGPEAEEAIQVTEILGQEMKTLSDQLRETAKEVDASAKKKNSKKK